MNVDLVEQLEKALELSKALYDAETFSVTEVKEEMGVSVV